MRVTFRGGINLIDTYAFSCVSYRALFSSALFALARLIFFALARNEEEKEGRIEEKCT